MPPEEILFRRFLKTGSQNRYIELLRNIRSRKKLRDRLNHTLSEDLDARYCRRLARISHEQELIR
jgi:hypothetical protein